MARKDLTERSSLPDDRCLGARVPLADGSAGEPGLCKAIAGPGPLKAEPEVVVDCPHELGLHHVAIELAGVTECLSQLVPLVQNEGQLLAVVVVPNRGRAGVLCILFSEPLIEEGKGVAGQRSERVKMRPGVIDRDTVEEVAKLPPEGVHRALDAWPESLAGLVPDDPLDDHDRRRDRQRLYGGVRRPLVQRVSQPPDEHGQAGDADKGDRCPGSETQTRALGQDERRPLSRTRPREPHGAHDATGQTLRQKFPLRQMVERIATGSEHRHLALCGPQ